MLLTKLNSSDIPWRIQSDLREGYRRLARLVADRREPGTNAAGSCLAGNGDPSETG